MIKVPKSKSAVQEGIKTSVHGYGTKKKNPYKFPEIISGFEQQMRIYCVSSCLLFFWAVEQQGAQDSGTQRKVCHIVLYQLAAPWWRHCSVTWEIPELLVVSTTPNTFKFLGKRPRLCGTISNSSSSFSCKISRRTESVLSSFKIFQLTLISGAGFGTKTERINFQFRFGNLNSQREAGAQLCPYT